VREGGPWEIAEIIHTPCTSRREEKPKNAAVVMTAENTTGLKLSPNNSLRIGYLNTLILSKNHLVLPSKFSFLLAVGHRVKYALRNSEAPPQTNEFRCIYQSGNTSSTFRRYLKNEG
jgi:hypothetical protein